AGQARRRPLRPRVHPATRRPAHDQQVGGLVQGRRQAGGSIRHPWPPCPARDVRAPGYHGASMQNLVSLAGIFVFLGCAWLLSENRRAFPWRVVAWGLGLQLLFAALVLWWEPGSRLFLRVNDAFAALLAFSREGIVFVFGSLGTDADGASPSSLR